MNFDFFHNLTVVAKENLCEQLTSEFKKIPLRFCFFFTVGYLPGKFACQFCYALSDKPTVPSTIFFMKLTVFTVKVIFVFEPLMWQQLLCSGDG